MEKLDKKALRILVIAKNEPTFEGIEVVLQAQHYEVVGRATSVEQGLSQIIRTPVDIVLVDSSGDGVQNVKWIQELSLQVADTLVLVSASASEMDFVSKAMLAGAKGFLLKPFDVFELSRSIEQAYQLALQRQAIMASVTNKPEVAPSNQVHSIAVFSPKGGTGATTLAVNLAVALKQETNAPVLLVDADLQTADVDIFLGVLGKNSILDLLDFDTALEQEALNSVAIKHSSGIRVLRGDPRLQFIDSPVEPGQMNQLIKDLIAIWDGYIILNTNNGLDRLTAEVLDSVDTVLVVTTPQLSALRATRNFLELAEASDDENDKWKVVMTSYQGKSSLNIAEVEEAIHFPIMAAISEDAALVSISINQGIPLVSSHRKFAIAKDILALANQTAELIPMSAPIQGRNPTSPASTEDAAGQSTKPKKRFLFWQALSSTIFKG
jgi:pilus assembly protein CpaE